MLSDAVFVILTHQKKSYLREVTLLE